MLYRIFRKYLFLPMIILFFQGFSQVVSLDTIPSASLPGKEKQNSFIPKKTDFGIQLGTQFFTSSYGSGFSTYVAPHVSYGLSKRFSLSGGISIINTTFNGPSYYGLNGNEISFNGNNTSALVYLSGQYLLSKKVTITGIAWKQFSISGNNPAYNIYGNNDAHGVYMQVSYKVLDNFHIEAGFGYSKGYNPYGTYGSFYNDPFNRTFGDPFFGPGR